MAEANPASPVVAVNVAFFRGRVESTRSYTTSQDRHRVVTLLRLPARDEFSSAGAVEIDAAEELGKAGEIVSVKAEVIGSVRPFKWTDKDSGELKRGTEARVMFRRVAG